MAEELEMKNLPHTQCVKGKFWYFRAPSTRKLIRLDGKPGDAAFMEKYRQLLSQSATPQKRLEAKRVIGRISGKEGLESRALVYFIGIEPDGPIKIGTAINVSRRLCTLQVAMPFTLSLLATCAGAISKEKEYHSRFAEHLIRGEWFERVPDLLAEISRLRTNEG